MTTGQFIVVEGMNPEVRSMLTEKFKAMFRQAGIVCNNFKNNNRAVQRELKLVVDRFNEVDFIEKFDDDEKHALHLTILDILLARLNNFVVSCIAPALERGEVVVCNTYFYHLLVYHGISPAIKEYLSKSWEANMASQATALIVPDYVIYCANTKTKRHDAVNSGFEQWSNMLLDSAAERYPLALEEYKGRNNIELDTSDREQIDYTSINHIVNRIITKQQSVRKGPHA